MTRQKTPIIDDFSGEQIDEDETRYTIEILRAGGERGTLTKSNKLDIAHSSFKRLFSDKLGDGVLKWITLKKQQDGSWLKVDSS